MKILNAYQKRREEKLKQRAQKQLEAQAKTVRTPEVIGTEYNRICAEAGDKQYRIQVLQSELEQINEALRRLNQEFHIAQKVHPAKPAEAVPQVQAPAVAAEKSNEAASLQ